jgi:hypothetical protein
LEERIVSIFRVKEEAKQETSMKLEEVARWFSVDHMVSPNHGCKYLRSCIPRDLLLKSAHEELA